MELAAMTLYKTVVMAVLALVGVFCYHQKMIDEELNKKLSDLVLMVFTPILLFTSFQTEYDRSLLKGAVCSHSSVSGIVCGDLGNQQTGDPGTGPGYGMRGAHCAYVFKLRIYWNSDGAGAFRIRRSYVYDSLCGSSQFSSLVPWGDRDVREGRSQISEKGVYFSDNPGNCCRGIVLSFPNPDTGDG